MEVFATFSGRNLWNGLLGETLKEHRAPGVPSPTSEEPGGPAGLHRAEGTVPSAFLGPGTGWGAGGRRLGLSRPAG